MEDTSLIQDFMKQVPQLAGAIVIVFLFLKTYQNIVTSFTELIEKILDKVKIGDD